MSYSGDIPVCYRIIKVTKGNLRNTYMTKLNSCLYPWTFMMYIRFTFGNIWCISTKLRIFIRNFCIPEIIQNQIFGDSGYFSPKVIYGPRTWHILNYACILVWYIVFMMYIGFMFDQICCISTRLRICIRNVRIYRESKIWYLGILDLFAHWIYLRNGQYSLPDPL